MGERFVFNEEPLEYLLGLPYTNYIHSLHWHRVRDEILAQRPRECEFCHIETVCVVEVLHSGVGRQDAQGVWHDSQAKDAIAYAYTTFEPRPPTLVVHHITYDNMGQERDEDLVLLCVSCHAVVHDRQNASTRNWRASLARLLHLSPEEIEARALVWRPEVLWQELEGDF